MQLRYGLVASAMLLASTGAFAEDDPMAVAYENTVKVVAADGTESTTHYNQDGSFTTNTAEGAVNGTWSVNDQKQLCTTPEGGEEACADVDWGHGVGESWETKDAEGNVAATISIVAGRE